MARRDPSRAGEKRRVARVGPGRGGPGTVGSAEGAGEAAEGCRGAGKGRWAGRIYDIRCGPGRIL
jgi:hypothetical protein